ncbi:MAG: methyltransferase domain-containing protein [Magnetococcus sp. THC-1_WYH]
MVLEHSRLWQFSPSAVHVPNQTMPIIPIQPDFCSVPEVLDTQSPPMDFDRVRRAWQRVGKKGSSPFENTLLSHTGELLASRLGEIRVQPKIILDLGCRSGLFREALKRLNKGKTRIVSATFAESCAENIQQRNRRFALFTKKPGVLCSHPLRLPFPNGTFDGVLSNMALHWGGSQREQFHEIRRVLKPDGVFLFTIPGAQTLIELRMCLAELDQQRWHRLWPRIPEFPSIHTLGDTLLRLGFRLPVVDRDVIHPTFADTQTLLQHLRSLGGCNPHIERHNALTPKGYFTQLQHLYQSRYAATSPRLSATVEILFGHGWRSPECLRES